MKTSQTIAPHYTWNTNCDGWHLLQSPSLSVIQEHMPPGTAETLHYHQKAQQFFFILSGVALFELEGETYEVKSNEGFHVAPNQQHRISNVGEIGLHFLVISEPKSHGDRVNVE